ncbi:hypothetical protein Pcinc_015477 [Petrolisthes cinctipes]|uniref:G-protein coupled receptors family 1 profile domain-containing protein n=1 Tax=Petrolisthes cinctipes TaxID=88211 RepID=A0AAE1FUS8_PETCI|nr:hypothetical protein Pcinc_015477 [Petrolisthes cinctipes]
MVSRGERDEGKIGRRGGVVRRKKREVEELERRVYRDVLAGKRTRGRRSKRWVEEVSWSDVEKDRQMGKIAPISRRKKMIDRCKGGTSWFLGSLAVADLLLLVLCVPLEILQYFLWTPRLTLPVCRLSSYCELLSAVASVLNLTAVSLERYIVIVYPMRSRTFCTLSNCRRAIVVVWCISLALSVPAGLSQDVYSVTYYNATHNVTVYHCDTEGDHAIPFAVYRLVIVFILPALFMSFFYARVIKALWVSTKKMTAMTRVYRYR